MQSPAQLTTRGRSDSLEVFLIDDTLAFFDGQYPVHIHVSDLLNQSTRPAYFYQVYLRTLFKAEMQP